MGARRRNATRYDVVQNEVTIELSALGYGGLHSTEAGPAKRKARRSVNLEVPSVPGSNSGWHLSAGNARFCPQLALKEVHKYYPYSNYTPQTVGCPSARPPSIAQSWLRKTRELQVVRNAQSIAVVRIGSQQRCSHCALQWASYRRSPRPVAQTYSESNSGTLLSRAGSKALLVSRFCPMR